MKDSPRRYPPSTSTNRKYARKEVRDTSYPRVLYGSKINRSFSEGHVRSLMYSESLKGKFMELKKLFRVWEGDRARIIAAGGKRCRDPIWKFLLLFAISETTPRPCKWLTRLVGERA